MAEKASTRGNFQTPAQLSSVSCPPLTGSQCKWRISQRHQASVSGCSNRYAKPQLPNNITPNASAHAQVSDCPTNQAADAAQQAHAQHIGSTIGQKRRQAVRHSHPLLQQQGRAKGFASLARCGGQRQPGQINAQMTRPSARHTPGSEANTPSGQNATGRRSKRAPHQSARSASPRRGQRTNRLPPAKPENRRQIAKYPGADKPGDGPNRTRDRHAPAEIAHSADSSEGKQLVPKIARHYRHQHAHQMRQRLGMLDDTQRRQDPAREHQADH